MTFLNLFKKASKDKETIPLQSKTIVAANSSTPPMPSVKFDLKRVVSVIEYNGLQFLILDCPTESTLAAILTEFKKYHVTDVVRVCEATYNTKPLIDENINVLDIPYIDGGTPPQHVILKFLGLVQDRFADVFPMKQKLVPATELKTSRDSLALNKERPTIAVHCVAGMGRAPLMIAIALIEHGMQNLDAIDYIRERRRGAFNNLQIVYIDRYKRVLTKSGDRTWFKSFVNKMPKNGKSKSQDLAK